MNGPYPTDGRTLDEAMAGVPSPDGKRWHQAPEPTPHPIGLLKPAALGKVPATVGDLLTTVSGLLEAQHEFNELLTKEWERRPVSKETQNSVAEYLQEYLSNGENHTHLALITCLEIVRFTYSQIGLHVE